MSCGGINHDTRSKITLCQQELWLRGAKYHIQSRRLKLGTKRRGNHATRQGTGEHPSMDEAFTIRRFTEDRAPNGMRMCSVDRPHARGARKRTISGVCFVGHPLR